MGGAVMLLAALARVVLSWKGAALADVSVRACFMCALCAVQSGRTPSSPWSGMWRGVTCSQENLCRWLLVAGRVRCYVPQAQVVTCD